MFKCFKSTKVLYYVTSVLGVFILVFCLELLSDFNIALKIAMALLWILVAYVTSECIAILLLKRISKRLWDECDSIAYISAYEKALSENSDIEIKPILICDLIIGYVYNGDYLKASQYLESLDNIRPKKYNYLREIRLEYVKTIFYIQQNDFKNAEECVNRFYDLIRNNKRIIKSKRFREILAVFEEAKLRIAVNSNVIDGIENQLLDLYSKSTKKLQKLILKKDLAAIYRLTGQYDKEKATLDFIETVKGNVVLE